MRQAAKMIKSYERTGNLLIENSYVDGALISLPTVNVPVNVIQEAEENFRPILEYNI